MDAQTEWRVEGFYTDSVGWEHLTTHDDRPSALDEARTYDENEPGVPHRAREYAVDRCSENARRGTGTGACDRPLDGYGQCDRASDHL
jgi:hypothetical protein